jgi:hypothetical protein
MKMKKELVDKINKTFGHYKNDVISLSDKNYKRFVDGLMDSAKSVNDLINTSSVIAVMNGWRMENKVK